MKCVSGDIYYAVAKSRKRGARRALAHRADDGSPLDTEDEQGLNGLLRNISYEKLRKSYNLYLYYIIARNFITYFILKTSGTSGIVP